MEKFLERIPLEQDNLSLANVLTVHTTDDEGHLCLLDFEKPAGYTMKPAPLYLLSHRKIVLLLNLQPDCKKEKETKEKQQPSHLGMCVCLYVLCWQRSKPVVAHWVKNLPAMQETQVQFLGWEDPLEEGTATHSSILAWRIPWTKEPGRLQSKGSQKQLDRMEETEHKMQEQDTSSFISNTFSLLKPPLIHPVRINLAADSSTGYS